MEIRIREAIFFLVNSVILEFLFLVVRVIEGNFGRLDFCGVGFGVGVRE